MNTREVFQPYIRIAILSLVDGILVLVIVIVCGIVAIHVCMVWLEQVCIICPVRLGCVVMRYIMDQVSAVFILVLIYCDYFWGYLSDLHYAYCGGRCANGTFCGVSCLFVNFEHTYTNWTVGACIVIR